MTQAKIASSQIQAEANLVRILVPLSSAGLGGSQLFLLKLIDAMPGTFSFTVCLLEDGSMAEELRKREIPYRVFSRAVTKTPWGLLRLRNYLQTENPDIIYLHASRVYALLARQLGIPCVERLNMSRKREVGGWCNRFPRLDRMMTEWNTKLIAVSDAIRQQLLARGVSDDKIEVIRNFVDVERFSRPKLRAPVRQELGIPKDAMVVLNVGRMVPQKGQEDFLKVAARCLPKNERLYFLLVGDGPLREEFEAQTKELELDKTGRFQMLAFQKDIERIYASSDILVHTARWDPLANVLLEAMAAGLTIVATDVDGTGEALEGYPGACIVSVADIDAMCGAILNYSPAGAYEIQERWRKELVVEKYCRLFTNCRKKVRHE